MPKSQNIAVIGCGHWGKNLVRNYSILGNLAAVSDPNEKLAHKFSEEYKVPELSFETILTDKTINGVVIAAPAAQHYALAKMTLNSGKHVFVEKPLSLQINEAEELCELAENKNRVLMVGHLLQYHPAFLEFKKLTQNGKLGKLQYIYSNRLNLGKIRSEENILWSFAPHDISMILSLAGESPESVYATGSSHINPKIQDVTTTHMTFKNNIQAHVFVSWLHPFKEQKLVVVGENGMAVFDDSKDWGEKLQLYPHKVNWIEGLPTPEKAEVIYVPIEPAEPLRLECQHFIDCITENKTPRTNGREGLNVLKVLDSAQRSLVDNIPMKQKSTSSKFYCHETAIIDKKVKIGDGTKIWHFSHILENTAIGKNCTIGQNVMIGPDVQLGNNCKIQNNVSLYKGVELADDIFCGPSCVFTNVNTPRANIERKDIFLKTCVERGTTIGANATIICGSKLGSYSFIGAGAVVTKDVKPHALMVGNPAKQVGWVSHAGEKLGDDFICPREGRQYTITKSGNLEEIERHEPIKKRA